MRRKKWEKEKTIFLSVFLLFVVWGCQKADLSEKKISPAFLWSANQDLISPQSGNKHTWSGFYAKDNFFVSYKNIARLILWRKKTVKITMSIHYVLKGKPVLVNVNRVKAGLLYPTTGNFPFKTKIKLKKGFNLIEFKKSKKDQLMIKGIKIGRVEVKKTYDLSEGECVTAVLPPGSGDISFEGKGKLNVRKVEFINGEKLADEKDFKSKKVKYPINFESVGFIEISCVSGNFNVVDFNFMEKAKEKITPGKMIKKTPNIFIFLIDGCQQSHLGVHGYHRKTSPYIDEFAKKAVIFENAYANATFTGSSVASLFTGMYPQRHSLKILSTKLSKKLFLLGEFLKESSYKTSIYTEAGNVSRRFGFTQGIDDYNKMFRRWDDPRYLEKNILKFFKKWVDTKGPIFSYIHYRAPHLPIIPPPPFLDMFKKGKSQKREERIIYKIKELQNAGYKFTRAEIQDITNDYDSTICYVDSELGKLFECLKNKKLYENSLIIFTSDHGEALYEHGTFGHGHNVYEETSRVPLIIKFPGYMNLTGRVDTVVQLLDIFPTIAAMFGKEVVTDGRSLFGAIKTKTIDESMAISTTFNDIANFGIRWRQWYYVINLEDNSEELFNIIKAPLRDVAAKNKDIITFFRGRFITWLNKYDSLGVESQAIDLKKLPADIRKDLKSLGYID